MCVEVGLMPLEFNARSDRVIETMILTLCH